MLRSFIPLGERVQGLYQLMWKECLGGSVIFGSNALTSCAPLVQTVLIIVSWELQFRVLQFSNGTKTLGNIKHCKGYIAQDDQ